MAAQKEIDPAEVKKVSSDRKVNKTRVLWRDNDDGLSAYVDDRYWFVRTCSSVWGRAWRFIVVLELLPSLEVHHIVLILTPTFP